MTFGILWFLIICPSGGLINKHQSSYTMAFSHPHCILLHYVKNIAVNNISGPQPPHLLVCNLFPVNIMWATVLSLVVPDISGLSEFQWPTWFLFIIYSFTRNNIIVGQHHSATLWYISQCRKIPCIITFYISSSLSTT